MATGKKAKAAAKPAPAPAPAEAPAASPPKTPADELWDRIRELPLELYSLPDQTLEGNCTRVKVAPDQLHLKLNSGAVIAAMTESLKSVKLADDEEFDITAAGAFTVLRLKKKFLP
jgi:hypothetical protein